MRKTFLLLLLLLAACIAHAQTQEEIDAVMKKLKAMQSQADSLANVLKTKATTNGSETYKPQPASSFGSGDMTKKKFPPKKTAALASLPKKVLTKPELVSLLTKLHADLTKKLPASKVSAAQTAIAKLNKNAQKIAATGVAAWYNNAPSEAVLLLTYAAAQSPDDNTLNNCGAVLNLVGLEQKAIPLLKYALVNKPGNSTLLNNIGQAYAGLGAKDSAMVYLMGCIRKNDTHPQACATAAYIENQNGNTGKAKKLAEQAITGGYTDDIVSFYKALDKEALLSPLLENNFSHKKLFDLNGFEVAPNCTNWTGCETVYARQQAFKKKLQELRQHFVQITRENSNLSSDPKDIMKWNSDKNWKKGPLAKAAFALKTERFGIYAEEKGEATLEFMSDLRKIGEEGQPEYEALRQKYEALYKDARGERFRALQVMECQERVALDNKYFEKKSKLTDKFKRKWLDEEMKVYDDVVFLSALIAPNEQVYKADCAATANWLLTQMELYSSVVCNPNQKPDCSQYEEKRDAGANSPNFKIADCPLSLEVPFVIGKIEVDCNKFEFEVGEGIILNFEKDFNTKESTLAIGIGAAVHIGIPGDLPVINGRRVHNAEASVKEQFYIKFDANNQASDVGMLWEAELKGGNMETKMGYSLGVNSGYSFEKGVMSGLVD